MFGFVTPYVPELKVKEHTLYKAIYCGLCHTMGQSVCESSRFALNYDFVFLALVRYALMGAVPDISVRGCAVHPIKKRPVASDDQVLPFCASCGALLTYYKIADDISDEKGMRRAAKKALVPMARALRRKAHLPELDALTADKLGSLGAVEREMSASADQPAELFGELLGGYFSHGLDGALAETAYEIGFHAGRWVYLIDAAADMEEDAEASQYNPYLCADDVKERFYGKQRIKGRRERACAAASLKAELGERISTSLTMELIAIDKALENISFNDAGIEALVKNIVHLGMPARADEALSAKGKRDKKNKERKEAAERSAEGTLNDRSI